MYIKSQDPRKSCQQGKWEDPLPSPGQAPPLSTSRTSAELGERKAERKGSKRKKAKPARRDAAEIPGTLISARITCPYPESSEGLCHLHCCLWAGDGIQVMPLKPHTSLRNKNCHARLKMGRLRLSKGCDLDQGYTAQSDLPASLLPPTCAWPPLEKRQIHSEGEVTPAPLPRARG